MACVPIVVVSPSSKVSSQYLTSSEDFPTPEVPD